MAHEISVRDGVAEFFSGMKQKAWHGMGQVIEGLATAEECLQHAHLNWTVSKTPLFIQHPKYVKEEYEAFRKRGEEYPIPRGFEVPDQYAIIRNDLKNEQDILGVVGERYTPYQNRNALSILDPIIEKGQAVYECAGALKGGRKVFLLAKLPEQVIVNGNDRVEPYILICTSHDGSGSLIAKLVMERVVCWNTLQVALKEAGNEVRMKHTANIEEKAQEATKILGLMLKQTKASSDAFNYMAKTQFDTTMLNYFLTVCFPSSGEKNYKAKNMRDVVELLFTKKGMGIDLAGKTAWGAYNAVSEYVSHHKNYNEKTNAVWFGTGQKLIKTAFNTALDIEKVNRHDMLDVIKAGS